VFCVSLGLEHQGRLACGVVYDPMREEMFWAEKGEGAYLNGERIRVSKIDDLNKSLLATGFAYDIRETKTNIRQADDFLLRAQGLRRCGSAALDLCYVACGRFEGFWEMKLSPWDTAAGAVIVEEAGGRVSDFRGGPVNIYHPEVVASNGLVHQAMMEVLNLP
jgi:myo-inositol-1(or 4)-monophosphatase